MSAAKRCPVLELSGTPRARGRMHGEAVRDRLREGIARWKAELAQSTRADPEVYIECLVGSTGFVRAVRRWTPGLWEEVEGIAEGAALDVRTVFAWQLPDEDWWFGRRQRLGLDSLRSGRCSALAAVAAGDRPALLAQTMDLPATEEGLQLLLRIRHDDGLEALVFTSVGMIAANGLNGAGVGLGVNTLLQLDHALDGLPVAFVVRGVLEQRSVPDALQFLHTVRHASGQNYIVAGKAGVFDLECSAHQVRRFIPYPGARVVYHTNHPLLNSDRRMDEEMLAQLPPERREAVGQGRANSLRRFAYLESRLQGSAGGLPVEEAKTILSSHAAPVCIHPKGAGGGLTFGCTVMTLGDAPQLQLAPGRPCETEFGTESFRGGWIAQS